jgi:hypothetical protein
MPINKSGKEKIKTKTGTRKGTMSIETEDFNLDRLERLGDIEESEVKSKGIKLVFKPEYHDVLKRHNAVKTLSGVNMINIEDRLDKIAKDNKELEKKKNKVKKNKDEEKKIKLSSKKSKKKNRTTIKQIFASGEIEEIEDETSGEIISRPKLTNRGVKVDTTEGTTLDSQLGLRFSPLLNKQMENYDYVSGIVEELKDDLETSKIKNKYRTDQTSNLLSAMGQQRALIKDMVDLAKTLSDLELKHAKELRSNQVDKENDAKNASRIGVDIIKGLYDDIFDEAADRKKKKKKKNKKEKEKEDEDYDDDTDKKLSKSLAKMINRGELAFTSHELHIDLEGDYEPVVIADEDDLNGTWRFILVDKGTGERRKDIEKEYPEILEDLPNRKDDTMKFKIDRLKAVDRSRKEYPLILK